jgi:hypothetical protein
MILEYFVCNVGKVFIRIYIQNTNYRNCNTAHHESFLPYKNHTLLRVLKHFYLFQTQQRFGLE